MTGSRKLLLTGGFLLAIWGMSYGLWYAVFAEHQILDSIGASLATSFSSAAQRKLPDAQAAISSYQAAKYVYDRQLDAHGHWIGLAMLLIVLGVAFDRVSIAEPRRLLLAVSLLAGAFLFPSGVLLETVFPPTVGQALAVAGSALVILPLVAITLGLLRSRPAM